MARWLGTAAVLCVLIGGCGGAEEKRAAPAQPRDTSITSTTSGAIAITEPALGAQYLARLARGALVRRVRVAGTAVPRREVVVDGGCRPRRCRVPVTAGADGAWDAVVELRTPRAQRVVTLEAAYTDAGTYLDAPATVSVKLLEGPPDEVAAGERADTEEGVPAAGGTPSGEPEATPAAPASGTSAPPAAADGAPGSVFVVGDSLAVGMSAPLRAALRGSTVRVDARTGRPLDEGMAILSGAAAGADVVAVSLFTNDDPRGVARLESAVRRSLSGRRCAVWATIVRPPVGGVGYAAANRALLRLAAGNARLRVADWAGAVAADRSLLAPDGVHGTPAGYRVRAQLYAEQLAACG